MTLTQRFISYETFFGVMVATALAGCASSQSQGVEAQAAAVAPPQTQEAGEETEPATTAPAAEREVDAQADRILKEMCTVLDGAKALRFRVSATMDRPLKTGQLAQFHRKSDVVVARPDRMYAKTESDEGRRLVWYRGKSLTVLDRDDNRYATEAVPGRLGEMLDYMADEYHLIMPMADLLVGKTYESLLADVTSGEYLGLHLVDDTKCHHLLFRQDNLDWQIWVDAGKQPLPRKLVITYTQEPGQPDFVATINGWNLEPAVSEETFTFTPPADAKDVEMSDLVAER
jgi:hypothetical protein